jgi:hypothetical protein
MGLRLATFLLALAVASPAAAYEVAGGDLVGRLSLGPSVNTARLTAATRATPGAGLLIGAGLELGISDALGIYADLSENVSTGFIDSRLSAGLRARIRTGDAPLLPYGALALTTALGLPVTHGEAHWNLGVRGALGFEYFLTRTASFGLEVGLEPSLLIHPLPETEWSLEALLNLGWRF